MKTRFSIRSIPLALLASAILVHGLLIPWLGFYWDDWPTFFFLDRFGPGIFPHAYGVDRPALGWLFSLTTRLVGESPLAWQVFALLTRWLASLCLWRLLREIWPERSLETAWGAFLFILYPGFRQQPIAFTYSADWIAISLFFLSLWLMLVAVRLLTRQASTTLSLPVHKLLPVGLLALSWLLAGYVMFADEYYFGLELLRPVFLWMILGKAFQNWRQRLVRAALAWAPYLALMAGFLYWRLVIFVSPRGQLQLFDDLASQPLRALINLAVKIAGDLFQSSLGAWLQTLDVRNLLELPLALALAALLLALVVFGLTYFFFKGLPFEEMPTGQPEADARQSWSIQALLVGIFALLIGGWPFWVTNLPIDLYFPWDRFNLAMMFGASLAFAGLVAWRRPQSLRRVSARQGALILAVLAGLATSFHFYNAHLYRQEWAAQRDFFWQLAWRAPQIKPGTLLLTSRLPFRYYSDNSLTAPLNLIYAPENRTRQLDYLLYTLDARLGNRLPELKPGLQISQPYRIVSFDGNTDATVIFFYDPPRCLKVINPLTDLLLPGKPDGIAEAAALSRLDLIRSSPEPLTLPAALFGSEPEHGWCYYYQKAELAGQNGDWAEAARLAELALALPGELSRPKAAELLPFIEAYLRTGQWETARLLTRNATAKNTKLAESLCPLWYAVRESDLGDGSSYTQAIEQLHCNFP
ncbi:MAG: hypothetical protein MUE67_03590 [Anaerolineales bacterium]|jgi:hypothetical protein|nr:hypothetical protein [Anaerolineales bacterium]